MDAASIDERSKVPNLRAFHVVLKPIGPICNLDCKYCFYLEKENLFPANERFAMPDHVLEEYVRQHIEGQSAAEISFAWQGGEPTLLELASSLFSRSLCRKLALRYRILNK